MTTVEIPEISLDRFAGTVWGENNQITVLGKFTKDGVIYHAVKCVECQKDPEIFGDGVFISRNYNFRKQTACGCSSCYRYSKDQYVIRLKREAKSRNLVFIEIEDFNKANKSLATIECPEHGVFKSSITNFLQGKGCARCRKNRLKEDHEMVSGFISSGCFDSETSFSRSDRLTKQGRALYWDVICGACKDAYTSHCTALKSGQRGCSCVSASSKIYSYIHLLKDGNIDLALKFGISSNSSLRIYRQESKTIYSLSSLGIWKYPNYGMCKQAERYLLNTLICSVVPKEEMKDGYTETTYISNLENIIKVYESFGGIKE